eukprot:1133913-Pyramimonas_sp.AAC.1
MSARLLIWLSGFQAKPSVSVPPHQGHYLCPGRQTRLEVPLARRPRPDGPASSSAHIRRGVYYPDRDDHRMCASNNSCMHRTKASCKRDVSYS